MTVTAKRFSGKLRCKNTVNRSRNYRKTEVALINHDGIDLDYIFDYCLELQGNQIYLVESKTWHHIGYIHDATVKFTPKQLQLLAKFSRKVNSTLEVLKNRVVNFGNVKIQDARIACKHGDMKLHSLIMSKRTLKKRQFTAQFKANS